MLDRKDVPSLGEIKAAMTGKDISTASAIDEWYYTAVRGDLY